MSPAAGADPLVRDADVGVNAGCITGNDGYEVVLAFGTSEKEGPGASIEVYDADHDFVMGGFSTSSTWTDSSVTGEIPVSSEAGEVGSATFAAEYALTGQTHTEHVDDRHGNTWTSGTLTLSEADMTLTAVEVPGIADALGPGYCFAEQYDYSLTGNDPAARVEWSRLTVSEECRFGGGQLFFDAGLGIFNVGILLEDGDRVLRGDAELPMRGMDASGPMQWTDVLAGEDAGTTTFEATVRVLPYPERSFYDETGMHLRTRVAPRSVDLTVQHPDGRTLTATCNAVEVSEHIVLVGGAEDHH